MPVTPLCGRFTNLHPHSMFLRRDAIVGEIASSLTLYISEIMSVTHKKQNDPSITDKLVNRKSLARIIYINDVIRV